MPEVQVACVYGGANMEKQAKRLAEGCQIVVATPGRLMDHYKHHSIDISHVTQIVLDEADEMLNMGFYKDVRHIIEMMKARKALSMFSATISREVMDIGWLYQHNAEEITVQPREESQPKITQYMLETSGRNKLSDLAQIIIGEGYKRVMVFCDTKFNTATLANQLARLGFSVDCLHGDLSQKERNQIMQNFRDGRLAILVATDVAARGIDVSDVDAVINYDVPGDNEHYTHRIGRTGRAKKEGVSYLFYVPEEKKRVQELLRLTRNTDLRFGIRVCIKINNRKILTGIAEIIGEADKIVDITVAIDKLDKIGLDNVNAELKEKGISDEAIAKLQPIILLNGTNEEKLATLKEVLAGSEIGQKGVEESEFILKTLSVFGLKNELELDLTLARGLNYYTGAIFEVKALDVQIGSITGGGRYDNLTGVFGMAGVSGVGISFGADRIFDVLNQLDLYPKEAVNSTQLLFINFGEKEAAFSLNVLAQVRAEGIRAEIFPDSSKMKKQMGYANAKNIPFVALVGENEMNENKVTLKNMETGEQSLVSAEELIQTLKK